MSQYISNPHPSIETILGRSGVKKDVRNTLPHCNNCLARRNPFATYYTTESCHRADIAPGTVFSDDNGPRFVCRSPGCTVVDNVLCLRCLVTAHKNTPGHKIEQLDMTGSQYKWVQTQVIA